MAWCFSTRASVTTVLTTHPCVSQCLRVNTLRPRQNGRHFADDTFKCFFLDENISVSINISLKFVPKGSINNDPALFQIMAWRQPGDKPLSEPMMVRLPTHLCVTRPQWVNDNVNCSWSPTHVYVFFFSFCALALLVDDIQIGLPFSVHLSITILSGFYAFPDKPLRELISNLMDTFIMVFPRPDKHSDSVQWIHIVSCTCFPQFCVCKLNMFYICLD